MDTITNEQPSVAVILSGKSRTGGNVEDTVRDVLKASGVLVTTTETLAEFKNAIEKAKTLHVDQIWVGGGDGSVRLAAKYLAGGKIPLGILPLGTGNSLARELGIPLRLEEAIALFLGQPEKKAIDVGSFDGDVFVNVATIGLTTSIAKDLQTRKKGIWGRLTYVPAVIASLRHCTPFHIQIKTPEGELKAKIFQFVAASGRTHAGPFPVTESASIIDGKLSLYAVRFDGPLTVFRYFKAMIMGRHTELPNVWALETTEADITLSKSRHFVIDGDRVKKQTVKIRVLPGALVVLVPPAGPTSPEAT